MDMYWYCERLVKQVSFLKSIMEISCMGGNLLFGLLNADVGLIAILSRGHFSWYATTWATWSSKDKMHKHLVNITTYYTTTGHWWPHCSFGLSDFLQHTAWSTTNSLSRLQEHPSPSPPTICLLCLTTINHQLLGGRLCEIQPFNSKECLGFNFSSQNQSWIQYWGHKNKWSLN